MPSDLPDQPQLHQQRIEELRRLLSKAQTEREIDRIKAQIDYWRHYA